MDEQIMVIVGSAKRQLRVRNAQIVGLIILGIAVLSACGSGGGSSETGDPSALPTPIVLSTSAPDPAAVSEEFLSLWDEGDYSGMYSLLDAPSREGTSETEFIELLEDFRSGTALSSIDYDIVSTQIHNPYKASLAFNVTLHSGAAGEIPYLTEMELTRDGADWQVSWENTILHPTLTDDKRMRLQIILPERGTIYDQYGTSMAAPAEAASLWIVPNQIGDEEAEDLMLSRLRQLFDAASTDDILFRYNTVRGTDFYTALGEVSQEEYLKYSGVLDAVGGVQARTYDSRYYSGDGLAPYAGSNAPHTLGYVSWIPEEDLASYQERGYLQDEFIGRMGLERVYDAELRGVPEGTVYLTDADGNNLEVIARREAEAPNDIYTTLDADLQKITQEAIENFVGAAVVLERDTGKVLAMASAPGFDPNLFDPENPHGAWGLGELISSPTIPYLNRATLGVYPAGSVFKIITMAAALESGEFEADEIYDCGLEFYDLPGVVLDDWRKEKEWDPAGEITLQEGLSLSCNPWFYHIGLELFNQGHTTAIPDMAKAFGLGQETGIELEEEAGLIPDPENKPDILGEEWSEYDHVGLAIGQSYMQATPLQVARYVAAIGNGGSLLRPQIVERIETADGEVIQQFEPEVQSQLPLSAENLQAIQEAMVNVVEDPKATAQREFRGLNLNVAGKTGTATSGVGTESHAWFTAYTFEEREDLPDIAVAVLLENQGEGSDWAAPVVRRIIEGYFRGRPILRYPWESQIRIDRVEEPEEETIEGSTE
jgi:penicillin-binding protein 2